MRCRFSNWIGFVFLGLMVFGATPAQANCVMSPTDSSGRSSVPNSCIQSVDPAFAPVGTWLDPTTPSPLTPSGLAPVDAAGNVITNPLASTTVSPVGTLPNGNGGYTGQPLTPTPTSTAPTAPPTSGNAPTIQGESQANANANRELAGASACWTCSFVGQYTAAGINFAQTSFSTFAGEIARIVTYAFMIWLTLQVIYMMMGFMGSPSEIFVKIIKRSAVFMLVSFFLAASSTSTYWNFFVAGPMQATTGISQFFLNASGASSTCSATSDVQANTVCLAQDIETRIKAGVEIGWIIFSGSTRIIGWTSVTNFASTLAAAIQLILIGGFIMVVYGIALVYFVFFLLDIFTRIVVISSFAGFFIGFYVLEGTRHISKQAFNLLLGSFVTLIASTAVLGFMSTVLNDVPASVGLTSGDWTGFLDRISAPNANPWVLIGPTTAAFWMLIMSGIGLVAMTKSMASMVSGIFGGGSAAGSVTAGAASGMVGEGAKMAMGAAGLAVGGAAYLGAGPAMAGAGNALGFAARVADNKIANGIVGDTGRAAAQRVRGAMTSANTWSHTRRGQNSDNDDPNE